MCRDATEAAPAKKVAKKGKRKAAKKGKKGEEEDEEEESEEESEEDEEEEPKAKARGKGKRCEEQDEEAAKAPAYARKSGKHKVRSGVCLWGVGPVYQSGRESGSGLGLLAGGGGGCEPGDTHRGRIGSQHGFGHACRTASIGHNKSGVWHEVGS